MKHPIQNVSQDQEKDQEIENLLDEKLTPYQKLGLENGADADTVKKAYRRFALKIHPDKDSSKRAKKAWLSLEESTELILSGQCEYLGMSDSLNNSKIFDLSKEITKIEKILEQQKKDIILMSEKAKSIYEETVKITDNLNRTQESEDKEAKLDDLKISHVVSTENLPDIREATEPDQVKPLIKKILKNLQENSKLDTGYINRYLICVYIDEHRNKIKQVLSPLENKKNLEENDYKNITTLKSSIALVEPPRWRIRHHKIGADMHKLISLAEKTLIYSIPPSVQAKH